MNTNHSNSNSFRPGLPEPEEEGLAPKPDDIWERMARERHAEDRRVAALHPVPLPSDIGPTPKEDIREFLARLDARVPEQLDALSDAEIMVLHRALREALAACGEDL